MDELKNDFGTEVLYYHHWQTGGEAGWLCKPLLKEKVEQLDKPNFRLIEVPGDNHNYEDVSELGKMVREFLAK